jgi:cytochrome oxidase Cu insertion factor (SCO1/SenC/PrrC family)
MLIQREREVAEMFRAQWTPSAVLVDAKGRIASHVIGGDGAIRRLIEEIENEDLTKAAVHFKNPDVHSMSTAPIGREVSEFHVTDIRGREITNDDLKGKPTLIAFWNTDCPYCSYMLDGLRDWDKVKGQDEPNLLVFSTGDPDAVEALGFASSVVMDNSHESAQHLGMAGTPSAVLIDENGIFVSETAIGAPDIWSLIGQRK